MELNEIKTYLKIDGDDEDTTLSSLLLAAKSYIKNATGLTKDMIQNNEILELYKLCLMLLISHWYENRIVETVGPNFHKLSFSLDTILMQLEAEYLKIIKGSGNNESR